jgi:inosose dehydratase
MGPHNPLDARPPTLSTGPEPAAASSRDAAAAAAHEPAAARELAAARESAAAREPAAASSRDAAVAGRRLAGAPISWGVCEVPGWGLMLPPERVLGEMAALGLRATELGPIGYLPLDAAALRALLDRHGLELAAAFVPLVLHEADADEARAGADRMAKLLADAGADVFVAAVVVDQDWAPRIELNDAEWDRVARHLAEVDEIAAAHGLTLALHPHAGTLVETKADVERALAATDVGWCFDSGHLLIGGTDPVAFARDHAERIVHVHLKDVDAKLAARVRTGELTLVAATQAGLFRPLGQGDSGIEEVVRLLDRHGYERWLVLEQDTAITGQEPPDGDGPVLDVRRSIEYLTTLAPEREVAQP